MIYQLPNGKIIYISIEAYLSMSDDDLKYINEMNVGSSGNVNPFSTVEDNLEAIDCITDDEPTIPPIETQEDDSIDFTFTEE